MDDTLRLDVWLWRARLFKTRTLAADHVRGRGVRLSHNGQTRRVNKPGQVITAGDVVTFTRSAHITSLEILELGERRGPPAEAQALYRLLEGGPS